MNIYQDELYRRLHSIGCIGMYDEEHKTLCIEYGNKVLAFQDEKGNLNFSRDLLTQEENSKLDMLIDNLRDIREYTDLYLKSPQMPFKDIREYRLLAEYGDVVLGGMKTESNGFMFSTWRQNKEHNYVVHGDYTTNFNYAKHSFATRSGLVDKNRDFSLEEATNIYKCIQYAKDNCETLDYEQEQKLDGLLDKLKFGYEQLEESPPSFEEANIPQLNM